MGRQIQIAPFAVLLILLVIVQAAFIALDCQQTPARVALQFTKDFYYLDADMQNYVCEELAQGSAVDDYLYAKRKEAYERGFSTNRLRHLFTELHVADATEDGGPVRMHVSGTYRVAINPVFMVVGKIFFLADEYHMDETLELVKEDDGWKVCGQPFGL